MLLGSQDWQRFSPSFRFIPCRDTLRHASCRILLASPPLQAPPLFRRSPRACLFLLAWLKCPEPSTQTPNPVPSVSPGRSALASSASFASAGSRDAWRPGELRQAGCDRAAQQRASSRPSLIGVISQNMFSKAGIHFLPFTIHLFSCARACTWCVPVCVMSVYVRACTVPRCALYNRISTSTTPPSSSPCLPPPILINSPPPTPPSACAQAEAAASEALPTRRLLDGKAFAVAIPSALC